MKNIRILFLSHKFYPDIGGIEVNSDILATEFHKAGHDVKLATWSTGGKEKMFPFKVYRSPGFFDLIGLHRWADVVYENNPCLRLAWPRLLFRTAGVIALRTWVTRTDGKIAWQDRLKIFWLKQARGVIAVSDAVRRKSWPEATVIGNPYRDQMFKQTAIKRNPASFVFLGRLVPDKGADRAIAAIAKLIKDTDIKEEVLLSIVGDGSEMTRLKDLAIGMEVSYAVKFTGVLQGENLVAELNKHRYLLVPSLWEEPFGNVALEGMACGCLPFVSNTGGLPDAVGSAGITFDSNAENDLYETIKNMLLNPDLEYKLRMAATTHLERHRPERIAARYLEVILFSLKNVKHYRPERS